MTVDKINVGQLWRRRGDGKAFIPAVKVADGWLNKAGNKRTAKQLHEKYVWIEHQRRCQPEEEEEEEAQVNERHVS